ncbi:MAG: hypothetical protein AAFW83_04975 [Pseudomonadota bacterium]
MALTDVTGDAPVMKYLADHDIITDGDGWTVKHCPLEFYAHYDLYQVRKEGKSAAFLFAENAESVRAGSRFLPLNGTSPNIHEANKVGGIRLDGELARAYARFFGEFVYGESESVKSPFLFIEQVEDIPGYLNLEAAEQQQLKGALGTRFDLDAHGRLVGNADDEETIGDGAIRHFTFPTQYQNIIFACHLTVYPGGYIEMAADQPLFVLSRSEPLATLNHPLPRPEAPPANRLRGVIGWSLLLAGFLSISASTLLVIIVASGLLGFGLPARVVDLMSANGTGLNWSVIISSTFIAFGFLAVALRANLGRLKKLYPYQFAGLSNAYQLGLDRAVANNSSLGRRFLYVVRQFGFAAFLGSVPFAVLFFALHRESGTFFENTDTASIQNIFVYVIDIIGRTALFDFFEAYGWKIGRLSVDPSNLFAATTVMLFRLWLASAIFTPIFQFIRRSGKPRQIHYF